MGASAPPLRPTPRDEIRGWSPSPTTRASRPAARAACTATWSDVACPSAHAGFDEHHDPSGSWPERSTAPATTHTGRKPEATALAAAAHTSGRPRHGASSLWAASGPLAEAGPAPGGQHRGPDPPAQADSWRLAPARSRWMGPALSRSEGAVRPVRRAMISAQMATAVSSGVRAPMSRPIGPMTRSSSASSTPASQQAGRAIGVGPA